MKIARQRSASPADVDEYRLQIEKCRKASRAMSILDQ